VILIPETKEEDDKYAPVREKYGDLKILSIKELRELLKKERVSSSND